MFDERLQLSDERLQHLAQVTVNAIAQQYNRRYQSRIPVPVPLEFDLELTSPKSAARALTLRSITPSGAFTIASQRMIINMTLYRDNVREFLNVVFPHEMAHLKQNWDDVQNQASSADHGYVWQIAMRAMSQTPKSTHSMNTLKAIAVYKDHKAKLKAKQKEAVKS